MVRNRALGFVAALAGCACATVDSGAVPSASPENVAAQPAPEPAAPSPEAAPPALSKTRREEIAEDIFGERVADPYRWLEDEKSPEVQSWMAERNLAARAHLGKLPFREALAGELKALYYYDWRSAPVKRGDRLFFGRRAKDQEKVVVFWQKDASAEPQVLIDPNSMSQDGSVSLGSWTPSWDGKKVAYLIKGNNADESTLHVLDVESGVVSDVDTIPGLRYTDASWSGDSKGFYYTWLPTDPQIPASERMGYGEIRYHALGTDPTTDAVLRERTGDPTLWQGASASRDGRWLFAYVNRGWSEADVYVRDLSKKKKEWRPLAVGQKALYTVEAYKDRFYVLTNEGAPRYRMFSVDPAKLARRSWKLIVREDETAVLDGFGVFGGQLGLTYLRNASSELEIRTLSGDLVRKVALPAIGTTGGFSGNPDDDEAYFSFYSFTYPEEIYRTSIKTGKTGIYAKVALPVDSSKYQLEQVFYPSKDGTRVSMFILHKRGLEKNGANPVLLYGYGGFNISLTPGFQPSLIPWLDRGGVYALPNLRGGGEYGEAWHQAGMLDRKQNVFDDYIAAAEWLIANHYTRPGAIAARGGSNGGLLVGAAMTQRPDLFGAVICAVPLLDMIRYPKFGIGKSWVPEYGDPEDAAQFHVLLGYSPYHHVKPNTAYPALLLMSADSDDRVDPMHARKFAAMIEASSISGRANLLRIETHAGHGGGDMRKKALDSSVDELSFLLSEIGAVPGLAAGSEPQG